MNLESNLDEVTLALGGLTITVSRTGTRTGEPAQSTDLASLISASVVEAPPASGAFAGLIEATSSAPVACYSGAAPSGPPAPLQPRTRAWQEALLAADTPQEIEALDSWTVRHLAGSRWLDSIGQTWPSFEIGTRGSGSDSF